MVKKKGKISYTNEDLRQALEAVKKGKPVRFVAKQFNIPKSTLFEKKKGTSKPMIIRKGPSTVLGEVNEARVVEWIFYMADHGFPITRNQLQDSIQLLMKNLSKKTVFTNNRPGRHWLESFLKRHPELCERLSQNMLHTRASVNEQKIRQWFEDIRNYLESKSLINIDASRVFNCDESAFHLCPRGNSVLAKKGDRTTYNFVHNDEKECLTVLFCGNAAGNVVEPMVMFSYKRIPPVVAQLMPKGWGIGRSESGWMTGPSFYEWVGNIFHPWLIENKIQFPVILYLDGHASHLSLELSDLCRLLNIEIIALFPNSTHILQPMDVAVFHPLKNIWKAVVPQWRLENNGERMKREHFGPVLKRAVDLMNWKSILRNGFKTTGLFPFSPDAVNYQKHFKMTTEKVCNEPLVTKDPSNMTHLEFVESGIDEGLLRSFKLIEDGVDWTGEICHKSLFSFWRQAKAREQSNETRNDSELQASRSDEQIEFSDADLRKDNDEGIIIPLCTDDLASSSSANETSLQWPTENEKLLRKNIDETMLHVEGSLIYEISQDGTLISLMEPASETLQDLKDLSEDALNDSFDGQPFMSTPNEKNVAVRNLTKIFENNNGLFPNQNPSTNLKDDRGSVSYQGNPEDHDGDKESEKEIPSTIHPVENKCPWKSFPSPFKNSFHWPTSPKKVARKSRYKENIPLSITSDMFNDYLKSKVEKNRLETEEKEKKRQERLQKQEERKKEKEMAKIHREMKKEKSQEVRRKKEEAKKRSPTVLAKKRGRKKGYEKKIAAQRPLIAKKIKKEILESNLEADQNTTSHSTKSTPEKKSENLP